jgi:hypothetical protein
LIPKPSHVSAFCIGNSEAYKDFCRKYNSHVDDIDSYSVNKMTETRRNNIMKTTFTFSQKFNFEPIERNDFIQSILSSLVLIQKDPLSFCTATHCLMTEQMNGKQVVSLLREVVMLDDDMRYPLCTEVAVHKTPGMSYDGVIELLNRAKKDRFI